MGDISYLIVAVVIFVYTGGLGPVFQYGAEVIADVVESGPSTS